MNGSIKKLILFLCSFAVLAMVVTYFKIESTRSGERPIATEENGIDLYGTYDQNDLYIIEKKETYKGVDIQIPQIDGLKDKEVQKKINDNMYRRACELLEGFAEINYANFYTRANFGNTISISFHAGDNEKGEHIDLNYELITGEQLELQDLFLTGTDITDIVRRAFYDFMVQDYSYMAESGVVSIDENELYKVVKGYLDAEEQKFSYSPAEIYLYYDDIMASVDMIDIAADVSVYSKYMTKESLYEKDDIGFEEIFTCADSQYDAFEVIDYGYLEPNFWYDITIGKPYFPDTIEQDRKMAFDTFKEEIIESVYRKIEEQRAVAQAHPDTFYIFLAKPNIHLYSDALYKEGEWEYHHSNVASVNENIQVFELPVSLYDEVYKDKLMAAYRYRYFAMSGGVYLDAEANDGAMVTEDRETKLYNYFTGEALDSMEDVFYEVSGYQETLRFLARARLMEAYGYERAEAVRLAETLRSELSGTSVIVTIPEKEEIEMWFFFDEFERSMMKIF